jgi:hypothetical protein
LRIDTAAAVSDRCAVLDDNGCSRPLSDGPDAVEDAVGDRAVPDLDQGRPAAEAVGDDAVGIAGDLRAFDPDTGRVIPPEGWIMTPPPLPAMPLFANTESVIVNCAPAAVGANWTASPGDAVKF